MTEKDRQNQLKRLRRTGWIFIFIGFFFTTVLTVLETALKNFHVSGTASSFTQIYNINIGGWLFSIPSFFIICGILLIMVEFFQVILSKSKWGKK